MRIGFALIIATLFVVCLWGCSGGQLEPITEPANPINKTSTKDDSAQRILFGIWEIGFDPAFESVSVIPSRNIEIHFNITNYVTPPQCDDCLGITIEGFNPDGWVYDIKVTLENPTPLTAYDVRGTLLIGADDDNRAIINVDDYTELFDDTTPPDRNPFKVFATDQPGRVFLPDAIHEVLYQISIPPPPNFNVKFVIDGSWPNNQKDPYEIYDQEITGELFDNGSGNADVVAYIKDWQMDVEWVKLDVTPLGALEKLDMVFLAGTEWQAEITNEWLAPAGEYELWLEAKSQNNAQILYDKITLTISEYVNTPPVWDDTVGIVSAIPGNEEVLINYGAASDPDEPVTYNIYCSSVSPIDFETTEPENDADGSSYLYEGLANGQTYYFAVRAMDGLGLEEDNIIELPATPTTGNQPPVWDDFTGITDVISGDKQVTCIYGTASDPDEPVTYNVYYSTEPITDYSVASKLANESGSPSIVLPIPNGIPFWFGVRAEDGLGMEDDNTVQLSCTPVNLPPVWDDTVGITDAVPGDGSVTVHFGTATDPSPPVTYNVYYSDTSPIDFGTADVIAGNTESPVMVDGLSNDQEYYFAVRAQDDEGLEDENEITLPATPFCSPHGWGLHWGGYTIARAIAYDEQGYIYVTGEFHETTDFNPDPNEEDIHTPDGVYGVFLSKFTPDGDYIWGLDWGRGSGLDVAVDNTGNIYVTGHFAGTVDFDPGPGVDEHQHDDGSLGGCFVSKIDGNGNYLWARTFGGTYNNVGLPEISYGVGVDDWGNVYVTGHYIGTVDFDPGEGVDSHTSNGSYDCFLAKYNGAGDFQWARTWGGTGGFYESTGCSTESGINLSTDSLGNIYVAGLFFNKVDFDPDPVDAFEETAVTTYCGFVSKFDSSGDFQWVDVWGYTAWGITVDHEDFICVAGRELDGPCIKKYNQSGGLLWEGTWHNICFCLDIGVDGSNNIFTTGYYFGTVDFDPDPEDEDVHTSGYSEDIFTSKFDTDGDLKWVRTWGGTTLAHGYGIAVAHTGEAYTTGSFIGYGFDMDPGPGEDYHDNLGGPSAFLIKVLGDGYW